MIASSPIQHDKNIGEIRCFMSHSHACDLSDLSNLNQSHACDDDRRSNLSSNVSHQMILISDRCQHLQAPLELLQVLHCLWCRHSSKHWSPMMTVFLFYADVILDDLVLQIVALLHQSVAD